MKYQIKFVFIGVYTMRHLFYIHLLSHSVILWFHMNPITNLKAENYKILKHLFF